MIKKAVCANSFLEVWQTLSKDHKDIIALKDEYVNVEYTYSQTFEKIKTFASGLAQIGLKKGDHLGMFSENSANWLVADQAMLVSGIVNAVRGVGASTAELMYIFRHSDSKAVVVQDAALLRRLKDELSKEKLMLAIVLTGEKPKDLSGYDFPVYSFNEVMEMGEGKEFKDNKVDPNSLATFIYTSGTTGEPKGAMISHRNLLSQIENAHYGLNITHYGVALCVLPIWHAYERTCEYYILSQGVTLAYTNIKNFKNDFEKYKPTYLISVPRIWESVYQGIKAKFKTLSKPLQRYILFCLDSSVKFRKAKRILKGICTETRKDDFAAKCAALVNYVSLFAVHTYAMNTIYKQMRNAISPDFRFGVSGGGSLSKYLDEFFDAIGLPILNGYGLTEASPIISVRVLNSGFINSIGPVFRQTETKVLNPETLKEVEPGQKGVLFVKGPQVMMGYYKDEENTRKVITKDGWLNTGDLVWMAKGDNIVIVGREKETIVLSNGENIEPQGIENACLESPYIKQIVLIGQDRPSLGALVVPDINNLKVDLKQEVDGNDISVLENPKVKELIKLELKKRVQDRPNFVQFERISNFRLLERELSQEEGFVTQTGKIRRNNVFEYYKDVIETMYSNV